MYFSYARLNIFWCQSVHLRPLFDRATDTSMNDGQAYVFRIIVARVRVRAQFSGLTISHSVSQLVSHSVSRSVNQGAIYSLYKCRYTHNEQPRQRISWPVKFMRYSLHSIEIALWQQIYPATNKCTYVYKYRGIFYLIILPFF